MFYNSFTKKENRLQLTIYQLLTNGSVVPTAPRSNTPSNTLKNDLKEIEQFELEE